MAKRWDFFFRETVSGLRRNGLVAFAAISTAFIALFLFGMALLIGREIGLIIDATTANVEVAVYLTDPVNPSTVGLLTERLESLPAVGDVRYETKEEACARFKEIFANQSALVDNVSCDPDKNPLPASLRVKMDDPEQFQQVAAVLGCVESPEGVIECAQPGIRSVVDQRQILDKLFAVVRVLSIGVGAIALVMLGSAAALIANTVRMGLFARRKEIGIMKLVGATNWRIRIPFLVEGLVESLIAAGAAILALYIGKVVFIDRLRNEIGFFPLIHNSDVLATVPWLLGVGALVALVAGFVGMRRFLDV